MNGLVWLTPTTRVIGQFGGRLRSFRISLFFKNLGTWIASRTVRMKICRGALNGKTVCQLASDYGFKCMKFGLVWHLEIFVKWLELDNFPILMERTFWICLHLFSPLSKTTPRYQVEFFQAIFLLFIWRAGGCMFLLEIKMNPDFDFSILSGAVTWCEGIQKDKCNLFCLESGHNLWLAGEVHWK